MRGSNQCSKSLTISYSASVTLATLLLAGIVAAQPGTRTSGPSNDRSPSAPQSDSQDNGTSAGNRQDKSDPPPDSGPPPKGDKNAPAPTVKLRIEVTNNIDKPVSNASVYIRFSQAGGLLHHDKLAELDLKTNQDGSVKVPPIPQGQIMIQIVAPGWHTYGKWYEIDQEEDLVKIKLEPPPHWY